ncbi:MULTISPECIES: DUF6668 family protein [Trueperella]|uniref:DUF6668 family protein n=1 Tax=Trueperella TaxID=1069494 RepID=UPI001C20C686|nr:DUF6668 family protein [Trueperella pecoris]
MAENPWIDGEVELTVVEPPQKIEPPTWSVVAGISPEDAGACALPVVLSDHHEDIVLVGAHGGAGTSTLAQLTGLIDGGHRWPVSAPVANRVLVVARTHMAGLQAAQAAALRVYSGAVRGVEVVGAVLVADVPGRRLPRQLSEVMRAVKAAYPKAIEVGWIDDLRFGVVPDRFSRPVSRAIEEMQTLNKAGQE